MEEAQFWKLIEQSRRRKPDCDEQAERLTRLLRKLPPEEIVAFDCHFAQKRIAAYRWDLWGVAYLISGIWSNDGFEYFRCWLIGQGQAVYERALEDPESLGDLVDDDAEEDLECEALMYAADHAYKQVTGTDITVLDVAYPPEPAGERWTEDDLDRLFPKLAERF